MVVGLFSYSSPHLDLIRCLACANLLFVLFTYVVGESGLMTEFEVFPFFFNHYSSVFLRVFIIEMLFLISSLRILHGVGIDFSSFHLVLIDVPCCFCKVPSGVGTSFLVTLFVILISKFLLGSSCLLLRVRVVFLFDFNGCFVPSYFDSSYAEVTYFVCSYIFALLEPGEGVGGFYLSIPC